VGREQDQVSWRYNRTKSAPRSPSRSLIPCRFKHSHLASRMSQGERFVARVHAHPRSMGLEIDSLLYAITPVSMYLSEAGEWEED
jgi:hypothetical protein